MKKPRKPKPKAKRCAQAPAQRHVRASPSAPAAHASRRKGQARHRQSFGLAPFRPAAASATRTAASAAIALRTACHRLQHRARNISLTPVQAMFRRMQPAAARTFAHAYSRDERRILLLFVLPFLMVASAVLVHQSASTLFAYVNLAASEAPETEIASIRPQAEQRALGPPAHEASSATPQMLARAPHPSPTPLATVIAGPQTRAAERTPVPEVERAVAAPDSEAPSVASADLVDTPSAPPSAAQTVAPQSTALAKPPTETASLAPRWSGHLAVRPHPFTPRAIQSYDTDENGRPIYPGLCTLAEAEVNPTLVTGSVSDIATDSIPTMTGGDFGMRLARAAEAQTESFVIYDDAYRSISYPMGDVHRLFGVCTDVVVRAYRTLGVDLQTLVHRARSGRGDRNIDHRRTEILRRFFAAQGESLPVSSFAEDYRPGDIVTYHRPQNSGSRSHIAIVSSEIAPSGRPMIVHNRGWGPEIEDALFVDQITGHYRYRGPVTAQDLANLGPALRRQADAMATPIPISLP